MGVNVNPLIAQVAAKIADVINDFKRELDNRDGIWAKASGRLELSLKTDHSETYELSIVPDADGDEYPITVQARPKRGKDAVQKDSKPITALIAAAPASSTYKPTRRASNAELEKDIVSRKKRQLDHGENYSNKRARTDVDDYEDVIPQITKEDLDSLLSKLREDIQEDTSECVNHVQKLLRRFKEEWHEKSKWDCEQASAGRSRGPKRDSAVAHGSMPEAGAFPSPDVDRDDLNAPVPELIKQEAKLVSSQIRWIEECRRVATDIHDQREENWRTTSAGFHDRNRQNREDFQQRILHESDLQGALLNQILSEVKAIGLYTQSIKWETPSHLSNHSPYPPVPAVPPFPIESPPSPPGRGSGGRGGREPRGTGHGRY